MTYYPLLRQGGDLALPEAIPSENDAIDTQAASPAAKTALPDIVRHDEIKQPVAIHTPRVSQSAALISDFLISIYGPDANDKVWTCAFPGFPANWSGAMGFAHLLGKDPSRNNFYFCVGEHVLGADRRANGNVARQRVIIADDVGTKVSVDTLNALIALGFPEPTFKIETSPGNQTWGWVLDAPAEAGTDAWDDVARIRAWLNAKNLTDPAVGDAARYTRLPLGWNAKDKYAQDDGTYPAVTLIEWNRGHTVSLEEMGRALVGCDGWRLVPLPAGAQTSAMIARSGAIKRCADLSNPEPLMVLWQEMGMGLTQVRAGVVEALCPNIAEHTMDGREGTGFAFLGNGLMECSHGHCQHLSTPGFKQMMLEQADAWFDARRALDMDVPLGASDAKHFLTLTALHTGGALTPDGIAEAEATAEAVAQRMAVSAEVAAQDTEERLAALAQRFIYVTDSGTFFDTKERKFLSIPLLTKHPAVTPVIPAGSSGMKSADNVLRNRPDAQDVMGVTYLPGDPNTVVVAADENGNVGPHVNIWVPSGIGRRNEEPTLWLRAVEHLIPDPSFRAFILDWLAWVLQNPARRTPTIPFIISGQGSGKDVMLSPIALIMGSKNYVKIEGSTLGSGFNGWVKHRFLHLDEVRLDAQGAFYNRLKALTGTNANARVQVNEKFEKPYSFEFVGVLIAMSNEVDALKGIEHDDRRFAPYVSRAGRLGETLTPGEIEAVQSVEEAERVNDFLLSRDLSQFDAFTPPEDTTGSREEVISAALSEGSRAAHELVLSGALKDRRVFTTQEVMSCLQAHANPNVRNHMTANVAVRGLQAAGCVQASNGTQVRVDGARVRLWVGANVDAKVKTVLAGKAGKGTAPTPDELRALLLEDRDRETAAINVALGVP